MARKELVIAIKAVDQISAPIRRTMTAIGRMGRQAIDTTGRVLRSMGGLARSLLNVRTLFAGLAAAFAAAALVRSILRVAEGLDRTAKAARSLGIEVEEYSKLEFAADRSGIAVNQLAKAFITVQRNAAQYVRGEGGAAVRAFADLGANLTDANGRVKQGTALLEAILDPISKIQDEAVKTSKLYDIFGRTGAQFKNIGGDLVNLLRDAERYGSITRNQTVVAEAFQDSLTNLGRAWTFLRPFSRRSARPSPMPSTPPPRRWRTSAGWWGACFRPLLRPPTIQRRGRQSGTPSVACCSTFPKSSRSESSRWFAPPACCSRTPSSPCSS
jgi:hypothetical protein